MRAQVVLQGFQIIFPCAFAILFLSQSAHASAIGAALAAAYATLTVALITGSLLGGVKVAFGFSLGIGEAIAGNMVIGLSIDYTLHLSHAYMHSEDKTRDGKVSHAATTMGVTVLAGAFTTFTSALFMVPCQLTFFSQMCTRSPLPSDPRTLAPSSLFPSPLPSPSDPRSLFPLPSSLFPLSLFPHRLGSLLPLPTRYPYRRYHRLLDPVRALLLYAVNGAARPAWR